MSKTRTLSVQELSFINQLVKQGYSHLTAKKFLLSSNTEDFLQKDFPFWPSVEDYLIKNLNSNFHLFKLTSDSSVSSGCFSSLARAFNEVATVPDSKNSSVVFFRDGNFQILQKSKNRLKNEPISITNLENINLMGNVKIESLGKVLVGDIVISSTENGYLVKKLKTLNSMCSETFHLDHYDDALAQANSIVNKNAIWLELDSGYTLLSASYKSRKPKNLPEPSNDSIKEITEKYLYPRPTSLERVTLKETLDEITLLYLKEGWDIIDILPEVSRIKKGLEYAKTHSRGGSYEIIGTDYRTPEQKKADLENERMQHSLQTERMYQEHMEKKRAKEASEEENKDITSKGTEGVDMDLYLFEDEEPVLGDQEVSMEVVDLPEISNQPIILLVTPDITLDSFEEPKNTSGENLQFLHGEGDSPYQVMIANSKKISQKSKIIKKRINFTPGGDSLLSQYLSSVINFKNLKEIKNGSSAVPV